MDYESRLMVMDAQLAEIDTQIAYLEEMPSKFRKASIAYTDKKKAARNLFRYVVFTIELIATIIVLCVMCGSSVVPTYITVPVVYAIVIFITLHNFLRYEV